MVLHSAKKGKVVFWEAVREVIGPKSLYGQPLIIEFLFKFRYGDSRQGFYMDCTP